MNNRAPTPISQDFRPQFSLRTLLAWIAGLCALFAVLAQLPLVWGAMAVWFLVLIVAHVVGNALGTRLRDGGTVGPSEETHDTPPPATTSDRLPRPAATRLQEKTPLGRIMFAVAALGALAGGSLGGNAATFATGDNMTFSGLAVATISSAIIGGLFGFLAASCLQVIVTTVLDGLRAEKC